MKKFAQHEVINLTPGAVQSRRDASVDELPAEDVQGRLAAVPLWKARDILLRAVTEGTIFGGLGYYTAPQNGRPVAVSSSEMVMSLRLEVRRTRSRSRSRGGLNMCRL